jgi:DNA-binding NarL/FixJ family response regulator
VIVVLEDMDVRVQWLGKRFPGSYQWAQTVTELKATLALMDMRKQKPKLVILDHDLGVDSCESNGSDGLCGLDAAKWLAVECPVLVWSMNGPAAKQMVRALIDSGHRAKHIAFMEIMYPALVRYIASALEEP